MIAEESTAWPMVSRPTDMGGLGFGMKWNMGWMHDTLDYMRQDPIYRRYHHGQLTFSLIYAFNENFVLPLSHDEVVYGKGSLIGKMPGDDWQKFANLRALYGYMWGHPGKKLLFMGGEFGSAARMDSRGRTRVVGIRRCPSMPACSALVRDLNRVYRSEPALHQVDFSADGFEWLDVDNADISVIAFLRKSAGGEPGARGVQFHTGAAPAIFWWAFRMRGCLARDSQHRRARIRRRRLGQSRRRGIGAGRRAGPRRIDQPQPAAAVDRSCCAGKAMVEKKRRTAAATEIDRAARRRRSEPALPPEPRTAEFAP